MTVSELIDYMQCGREIEFAFDGYHFFLAPLFLDGEFSGKYYIYDEEHKKSIFVGMLKDVLLFEFAPSITLGKRMDRFELRFVL